MATITEARSGINNENIRDAPIMPVSSEEAAAYVGSELTCIANLPGAFTAGRSYAVADGRYGFQNDGASGSDVFLSMTDDAGKVRRFMRCPRIKPWELGLEELWRLFQRPEIQTVVEACPSDYARNIEVLRTCELMAGFKYYPGQLDLLARVGIKDAALVAAEAGTGKSAMAISLVTMKDPHRALVIAPQSTARKQWLEEIKRFAPWLAVFHLFTRKDYDRILSANAGQLPTGVYITWYEAFLTNGTRIGSPSLGSLIGSSFDFIAADEGHKVCHLETRICRAFLRLQPRYRYILTCTAIPNQASDLFPLVGWLAVPGWFNGDMMNDLWPYRIRDYWKFVEEFHATEDGYQSPVLSMPGRLSKLIKPLVAYTTKARCSPDYQAPERIQIRVAMSPEQRKLYDHYRDLRHVPGKHPLLRRRRQIAWLREICCDPAGFGRKHMLPLLINPVTPKVATIIRICGEVVAKGEQVVVINSRVALTDILQDEMEKLGMVTSRIDSTVRASKQSGQASLFKSGDADVMLMGLRCASSHSFENAKYEVIGSLDYANGPLDQAEGRVDRINSEPGVTIYTVICEDSIEEEQKAAVSMKRNSAALCLGS